MTFKAQQLPLSIMTTTCIVAYVMHGYGSDQMLLNLIVGIPAGLALLLAPFIPWRYNLSKRMSEWLYILLAIPFVFIYMVWSPEGHTSASTNPITELSTMFLICLAVQEQYRREELSRPIVVHFSLLGVLFHAGMSYDLKWYPVLVVVYATAAGIWLTGVNRRSAPLSWQARTAPVVGTFVALALMIGMAGGLYFFLRNAEQQLLHEFAKMMYGSVGNLMAPLKDSELGTLARMRGSNTVQARFWGPSPNYLKARVLTEYTHNKWVINNETRIDLQENPALAASMDPDGGPVMSLPDVKPEARAQTGRLLCEPQSIVLSPQNSFAVQGRIYRLRADALGIFHFIGPAAVECGLMWNPGPHEDLSGKSADDPVYLTVPDALRTQIEPLARQIAGNAPDAVGKAAAIQTWLLTNCTYRLDPPETPGEDRIVTFLFRNHQGYCEYFATGMALMLRSIGVRCRYVLGYMVHERSTLGGYYVIRNRDAHAWLEVYDPAHGWTTFDPTPPGENAATYQQQPGWLDYLMDQYGVWFTRFWASVRSGNWKLLLKHLLDGIRSALLAPVVLQVTVVGLLGIGLAWIIRGRRFGARRKAKARQEADEQLLALQKLLRRAESRLAREGVVRRHSETLLEFRESVQDADVKRLLELYSEYYYGARLPAQEELAALSKRIR